MIKEALISDDLLYRWWLRRIWDKTLPCVLFVMLNPSTADAEEDDNTIRRCIHYAKHWGYGGILVVNLFAYRATDPDELTRATDAIGKMNDKIIEQAARDVAVRGGIIVAAWGSKMPYGHYYRPEYVRNVVLKGFALRALKINKDGSPAHPLYLPKSLTPKLYA